WVLSCAWKLLHPARMVVGQSHHCPVFCNTTATTAARKFKQLQGAVRQTRGQAGKNFPLGKCTRVSRVPRNRRGGPRLRPREAPMHCFAHRRDKLRSNSSAVCQVQREPLPLVKPGMLERKTGGG